MILDKLRFSNGTDLLGAHMSTRGGLTTAFERATTIGASAVAIFTKNSNQWNAKPLTDDDCSAFRAAHARSGIAPLIAHASYLINLATTDSVIHAKSLDGMVDELERAAALGVSAVVLHPGAHLGSGVDAAIDQIARSLDTIHERTQGLDVITLLETAAGQGTCLGCTFDELARMIDLVDEKHRVGICIDSCHVFAAGYDIRTADGYARMVDEIASTVSLDRVGAFHINDSKKELGSRVDRHEHIGEGHLGLDAFAFVLNDDRFRQIAKVLETPKPTEFDADIRNLKLLRSLTRSAVAV